jgi:hypothetical protein
VCFARFYLFPLRPKGGRIFWPYDVNNGMFILRYSGDAMAAPCDAPSFLGVHHFYCMEVYMAGKKPVSEQIQAHLDAVKELRSIEREDRKKILDKENKKIIKLIRKFSLESSFLNLSDDDIKAMSEGDLSTKKMLETLAGFEKISDE